MSKPKYAPVDKEDPEELGLGQEDANLDAEDRHDEPFSDGKHYQDDPDTDAESPGLEVAGQSSGPEVFTPQDYQQMDFESTVNRDLDSRPLLRRFGYFFKTLRRPRPWKECYFPVLTVISAVVIFVLGAILGRTIFSNSHPVSKTQASLSSHCAATSNWAGWHSINYAFAFGDSWTSTAFNFSDRQPSREQPLGNPDFPGVTSSNATNWIGYLTTKYNQSFLQTYNLAVAGTTLDNHITDSYPIPVTEQIYQRFMPRYGEAYWTPWKKFDTLFIMFIGINDVSIMNPIKDPALAEVGRKLSIMHSKLLNSLYGAGARNFLLLNVPPLERCWQPPEIGQDVKDKYASDIAAYNRRVEHVAEGLKTEFEDANVFFFDVNTLFNEALDDPGRFEQLSGILNTTGFCPSYALGTPTTEYFDPVCGIRVDQYFWLNGLHPTYPIHDVLADHVVKTLQDGPNIC